MGGNWGKKKRKEETEARITSCWLGHPNQPTPPHAGWLLSKHVGLLNNSAIWTCPLFTNENGPLFFVVHMSVISWDFLIPFQWHFVCSRNSVQVGSLSNQLWLQSWLLLLYIPQACPHNSIPAAYAKNRWWTQLAMDGFVTWLNWWA